MHIKIGQDFTSSIRINLFPHLDMPKNFYHSTIEYITNTNNTTTMHFCSFSSDNDGFDVEVGCDVYSMNVTSVPLKPYSAADIFSYSYYLRLDHLILLNLANKLISNSFK